jgi:hypothetical protein
MTSLDTTEALLRVLESINFSSDAMEAPQKTTTLNTNESPKKQSSKGNTSTKVGAK